MSPANERGLRVERAGSGAPRPGKSWFFGIGINEYVEFPHLSNAVKDVEDILAVLREIYEVDEDGIVTLFNRDATRDRIITELDRLVAEVQPGDRLLLYYSGHGHLNPKTEKGYWIPYDAERDNTSQYIRNSTIRGYLEDIDSLHTLLISDSCFSGSLFVRGASRSAYAIDELESRKSRWAICSGRHDEEVYDGEPGGNSPFASSILDVLRTNRLAKLNVAKLADRVIEMTRAQYRQLPEGNPVYDVGHKGGQYVFRLRASENNFWEQCAAANTLAAYNDYLERFPSGKYADEALQSIRRLEEDREWEGAQRIDRIYAYQNFLRRFPDGRYTAAARDRIEALEQPVQSGPATVATKEKVQAGTKRGPETGAPETPVWKKYAPYALAALMLLVAGVWLLSKGDKQSVAEETALPPAVTENSIAEASSEESPLEPEPAVSSPERTKPSNPATTSPSREEKAWAMALERNDEATYQRYLDAFPNGAHRDEARQRLAELRTPATSEEEPAVSREEQAWQAARQQNTVAAYQRYLRVFPDGKYRAEAERRLKELSPPDDTKEAPPFELKTENLGGRNYRVLQFREGPTWMAENLQMETEESWCYDRAGANCSQYGRLYTWAAADRACRQLGWRLPTEADWRELVTRLGGDPANERAAYQALFSQNFNPAIGGMRSQSGQFTYLDRYGYYWTATGARNNERVTLYFFPQYKRLRRDDLPPANGLSCRCVQ
jgi:uncharacterized protein (TIGR02145 family)